MQSRSWWNESIMRSQRTSWWNMVKPSKKKSIHNVSRISENKPKASVLSHKCQKFRKRSCSRNKLPNLILKRSLQNSTACTKMPKGDKKGKNSSTAPASNQNAPFSPIQKKRDSSILKLHSEAPMDPVQYMRDWANEWTAARTGRGCASRILEV